MANSTFDITVVYIAGLDRSGSTLLANLLEAVPGSISVGELPVIWSHGWKDDWQSADGKRFSTSGFWQSVIAQMHERMPEFDPNTALALWQRINKRRHIIPLARALQLKPSNDEIAYIELFSNLYRAIAAVSEKPIIIDSGKVAYHSALMQLAGDDIQWREVHLVRDPRAVAFSRQRIKRNNNVTDGNVLMERHSSIRVSGRWLWVNILIWASRMKKTPTTRVVYEVLASFPAAEMMRLSHALDLTNRTDAKKIFKPLEARRYTPPASVAFSGNSSRFDRKETSILPDDEWKTSLHARDRWVVTVLTWPLRRLFRPVNPNTT